MNSMIQKNSSTYWKYIGLINQQFEGTCMCTIRVYNFYVYYILGLKLGYKTFAPKDKVRMSFMHKMRPDIRNLDMYF